jgi:sialidase-1
MNRMVLRSWPLAAACLLLLACCPAITAEPSLTKSTIFEAGLGGYMMYRIPGIVVTKRGTVLLYDEARRNSGSDWGTIDIVMRRSTDGGATFSPVSNRKHITIYNPLTTPLDVIAHAPTPITRNPVAIERKQGEPTDITYNNPVAISSRDGVVHFLFCVEYMRVFYMRSTDDGKTFSTPVEITKAFDAFKQKYPWRVVATGPGHGIELSNGRLIVPVWLALGTKGNGHSPSETATVYSDDGGTTWHAGDIAVADTPQFPSPNETTAVELADGRVMLNVRSPAKENRRVIVISKDGATNWSAPRFQQDLPDPICFASLARLSTGRADGKNRLLFSNPDNLTHADGKDTVSKDRKNLTVRLSYDEGGSWHVKRTIEPGSSGYSDMAVLPDGTILCYYETGSGQPGSFPNRLLVLARFNLEWLTAGNDSMAKKGNRGRRPAQVPLAASGRPPRPIV